MLVPKKDRLTVYNYLFNEGVLCAKKDFHAPKHAFLEVPNLSVIKLCQSLRSRGYVKEQFSWQWYYYFLTNEGIEYLRDYLHLTEDVVPATLKKPAKAKAAPGSRPEGDRPPRGEGGYRGRRSFGGDADKKVGAPGENFQPAFRGERGGRGGFGERGGRGGYRREEGRTGGYNGERGGFRGGRGGARGGSTA